MNYYCNLLNNHSTMSTTSPTTTPKDEWPKTILIKELHSKFGAEIIGVQWRGDDGVISEEQLQELRDAVHKYGFILLRATPLSDASHVSFSRLFASDPSGPGELDNITRFLSPDPDRTRRLRYYPHLELFDASNLSDDGNAILDPSCARAMLLRANSLWHSDLAYNPRRSSYSLLRAVELPPWDPEMGGNTEFADSRTAWEELAAEKKRELLTIDWTGVYNAAHSRKMGAPEFFKGLDPEEGPVSRHKVVQEHAESGRMNLCVGAYLWRLEDGEGKTVPGSEEMIKFLNEHVAKKRYVTSVRWEQPGDLVIWDNRAVLHRAGEFKGVGKYRRDMRRTTAFDQGPTAWGLNGEGAPLPTLESITKERGLPSTQPAVGKS